MKPNNTPGITSEKAILTDSAQLTAWEVYAKDLLTEYNQSLEEGLDIAAYEKLFADVAAMPHTVYKDRMADVLFDIVLNAPVREDYGYDEPSDWETLRSLMRPVPLPDLPSEEILRDKIHGAWQGRIAGCMLGKTVEGIRSGELSDLLKTSGNYPMHRYIRSTDLTEELLSRIRYGLRHRPYADQISCMPADDDTNYVVLAQEVIARYGRDFTPAQMAEAWMALQPKTAYCTAERVAFRNFVMGLRPPQSAVYKNPYREWTAAQIRGDYFGYINPGDPVTAADMAWRDASISHVKNGIYGEMFAAAAIAAAAVESDIEKILSAGMSVIPETSRLHEALTMILDGWKSGMSSEDAFAKIHEMYDEHTGHGWCHTISNAMIVAASLLYGGGDFGKSICLAVQAAFDTDCNGATVGSILGIRGGTACIGEEWTAPFHDELETQIFGVGHVKISERAARTMGHMKK